jgi:hypothetical protein
MILGVRTPGKVGCCQASEKSVQPQGWTLFLCAKRRRSADAGLSPSESG